MRITGAIFAILAVVGWTSATAEGLPFDTATAEYRQVVQEERFDAVIEAVQRSTVSAQTGGRIVEINFDVDDFVEQGSILLRMRDTEQRAAVEAAEARHQEARAEYNRARDLLARELMSKSDYDRAEAAVRAARAGLQQAREQLEHTVVRAPYSGYVVQRHVELGESAAPGLPLMSGVALEQLRATANVPQSYIRTVRQLSEARVLMPDGDGSSIPGERLIVAPFADPRSHTFQVRVHLPAGDHGIYPGMFAKVAFAVGETERLLIPRVAVVHRSEVTGVYVVRDDGRVSLRQVRLGRVFGDDVEVLAGITAGEQVALDPVRAGVYLKSRREAHGS